MKSVAGQFISRIKMINLLRICWLYFKLFWFLFLVPINCFGGEMFDSKQAIIVLGYSLNQDCSMSPILMSRLDKARTLYQAGTSIILSGGMPPKVIAKDRCTSKTEAEVMKAYMISTGVAEEDIYIENLSTSTLTNAYYSRVLHLDPMGIKKVLIVSNHFHEKLIRYCFDFILGKTIQFELVLASNEGCNENEIIFWDKIINQMVSSCYPLLFKGVKPGNLQDIHPIINAKYLTQEIKENRAAFEACFRKLTSLENTTTVADVI